jgi:hypothetical protein
MRYAAMLVLLYASFTLAQTTQPATAPASQPATQPADIQPDRTKPLGMVVLFDRTCADMGVEKSMAFYHTRNNAHRRYARAECEFYVAVNKLVREVDKKFGKDNGRIIRQLFGDSDDYSDITVTEEGDSAVIQRGEQLPYPLIRIDGKWFVSVPDWFEIAGEDKVVGDRLWYEASADRADDLRQKLVSGEIKTFEKVEELASGEAEE